MMKREERYEGIAHPEIGRSSFVAMQSTPVEESISKGECHNSSFLLCLIIPLLMAHIDNVSELHDMSTG